VTEELQIAFAGLALGARYALVALGFVIIYKATSVINFAQGGLLALGAYLTYALVNDASLPFWAGALCAVLAVAITGAIIERLVLRRMVAQPVYAVIMITIGLLIIIDQVIAVAWGPDAKNLSNPWGVDTVDVGGVEMAVRDLWTIGLAGAVLAAFFAFFRFTDWGVAMRATAYDPEVALANGISARKVYALSWAISGGLAAIAGITIAAQPAALAPQIGFVALLAFPAMIVGGLDSPAGAVVGGVIIGWTQAFTAAYQDDVAPWLGSNFSSVMPFVVMIVILLVRPYGLFGTPEVRRI
jgi:branched-chain amino acid transport system permease protein